jgi:hypothetical protein
VADGSFTGKDHLRVEHARGLLARCYSLWLIGVVQDLACVLRVVRADHDVVRSKDA